MIRSVRALLFVSVGLLVSCGAAEPAEPVQQATAPAAPDIAPDALREAATDERIGRVYEALGWRAIWDEARERELLAIVGQVTAHGLAPERFLARDLPHDPARRDAALTLAAIRCADALANGLVDPKTFRTVYTIPRAETDVVRGLVDALGSGRLLAWFESLAPQDAQYRALSRSYMRYRREAEDEAHSSIPDGPTLRDGDSDPRVPDIRAMLGRRGYRVARAMTDAAETRYGPDLAAAVTSLQEDTGLHRDGVLGRATLAVLNKSAAERARQLAVNLERLRWLDRAPPATRIDVNTGAAELIYWRDGAPVDRRAVAVGRPGWATPQLGAPIFRLVANPSWTVPRSIARAELAGKSAAELARRNMRRKGGWIVQQPGPGNALGQVKFDMRDRYAIYLHDTPAKSVFARSDRHLSHGCVRVEDALDFARLIAGQEGKRSEFEAALASGRERFVNLDHAIPVRLIYLTAFLDQDGTVRFRPDAYGWDDDVGRAMGLGRGRRPRAAAEAPDVGP